MDASLRWSRIAFVIALVPALSACQRREPLEAARARAAEALLLSQVDDLQVLIRKVEKGEVVTQDRIAIGIAEGTAKELFDASLPQEEVVGGRLRIRIEAARPYFQGNNAAVVFQASAHGRVTGATARLELGGRLVDFRIEKGRLGARVELLHFKVLESSLGDIGSDLLEGLVRDNLGALTRRIPSLQIPVHLEQAIEIGGLDEGTVVAKPGVLPVETTLAEVIPVSRRLWVLLDVKAGPWRGAPSAEKAP